jgi:hypothetical protein
VTKGCDCTSHYVEQLQSKAKKGRKPHGEGDDVEPHSKRRRKRGSNYEHDEEERGGTRSSHVLDSLPGDARRQSTTSLQTSYAGGRTSSARVESALQCGSVLLGVRRDDGLACFQAEPCDPLVLIHAINPSPFTQAYDSRIQAGRPLAFSLPPLRGETS